MIICRTVNVKRLFLVLILAAVPLGTVNAEQCELDNAALQAMKSGTVRFMFKGGQHKEIAVKVADNLRTRSAGFQRVCAETIAAMPILFLFEREVRPSFHMRNVVAPLDIAFINSKGKIDSIQAMSTYVIGSTRQPLYSPHRPVTAALEVHPGFYSEHGIDKSVKVSWDKELQADTKSN